MSATRRSTGRADALILTRLRPEQKSELEAVAGRNERSVAAEIRFAVARHLDAQRAVAA